MRIAVFSDVHGNKPALEAILADIKNNNIDRIIYLGDVIGIGPEPRECLDLIMNNDIEMVLGNHELYYIRGVNIDNTMKEHEVGHHHWIHQNLEDKHFNYLSERPLTLTLEVNNYKLLFQHFLIAEDKGNNNPFQPFTVLKENTINELVDEIDADYIFIGHEHRPYEVEYNNKKLFDGGSSGCVYNDITHYTIIDIDDSVNIIRQEIPFNRDELVSAFYQSKYPMCQFVADNFFGIKK